MSLKDWLNKQKKFFLYDRKLLGMLSQCAAKSLTKFFKIRLGKKTGIPGIVVAIQTFTAKTTLLEIMSVGIPISNALVADGLFMESSCFYVGPKVDLKPLRELFRAYLLKMFKKKD